jgi:hypothetical protein
VGLAQFASAAELVMTVEMLIRVGLCLTVSATAGLPFGRGVVRSAIGMRTDLERRATRDHASPRCCEAMSSTTLLKRFFGGQLRMVLRTAAMIKGGVIGACANDRHPHDVHERSTHTGLGDVRELPVVVPTQLPETPMRMMHSSSAR